MSSPSESEDSDNEEMAKDNPTLVMVDGSTGNKYMRFVDQKGLGKRGDRLRAGQVIGKFGSGEGTEKHLVPPGAGGELVSIADEGDYDDDQVLCVLRDEAGNETRLAAGHY